MQSPAQEILCLDLFQALLFIPACSPVNSGCCYTFWLVKVQQNRGPWEGDEAHMLQHREPFKMPNLMTQPLRSTLCLSSSFEKYHYNKIHIQLKLFEIRIIAREKKKQTKTTIPVFFFPETERVLALVADIQPFALESEQG